MQELENWKRLRHPHILEFYGGSPLAESPFFVCALKKNGDALHYLRQNPHADRRKLLHDASLGLLYLHNKSVIHRDLKAANILIDEHGRACLSDFGLSKIKTHPSTLRRTPRPGFATNEGTVRWMAPEQMMGTTNKMTDIYSFAMTIYEIFVGTPPFASTADTLLFTLVCDRQIRPARPEDDEEGADIDDDTWALVERGWAHKPKQRPRAVEVANELERIVSLHHDNAQERARVEAEQKRVAEETEVKVKREQEEQRVVEAERKRAAEVKKARAIAEVERRKAEEEERKRNEATLKAEELAKALDEMKLLYAEERRRAQEEKQRLGVPVAVLNDPAVKRARKEVIEYLVELRTDEHKAKIWGARLRRTELEVRELELLRSVCSCGYQWGKREGKYECEGGGHSYQLVTREECVLDKVQAEWEKESKADHNRKLAQMEQEMRRVFDLKVSEKEGKMKLSSIELYKRHDEMKELLAKQKSDLEQKRHWAALASKLSMDNPHV